MLAEADSTVLSRLLTVGELGQQPPFGRTGTMATWSLRRAHHPAPRFSHLPACYPFFRASPEDPLHGVVAFRTVGREVATGENRPWLSARGLVNPACNATASSPLRPSRKCTAIR